VSRDERTMKAVDVAKLVRSSIDHLAVTPDQVFELRVPNMPQRYGKPSTAAGYFDDYDRLAEEAARLERQGAPGIYVTLNVINSALLARAYNRMDVHPKATTSDADIRRRVWLPIDFDPVRPSGISSNKDELERARLRALEAAEWLTQELIEEPAVWAFSGNGFHLLLRIDLPNDKHSTGVVQRIINATAVRFGDAHVSVDRTVFNAARIWKLYGTMARKGDEVPKQGRVHRRARILGKGFEKND